MENIKKTLPSSSLKRDPNRVLLIKIIIDNILIHANMEKYTKVLIRQNVLSSWVEASLYIQANTRFITEIQI